MYDHGARNRNPISTLWYGIDPLFEKYPDYSPYNYCAGNPVKFIDPNGRDGKVEPGSDGSESNPIIITANYYYSKSEIEKGVLKNLQNAIGKYNNKGKAHKFTDSDGSDKYMRFNFSLIETADPESDSQKDAFVGEDGFTHYYGNKVKDFVDQSLVGTNQNGSDAAGSAGYDMISINSKQLKLECDNNPYDSKALEQGIWVHEIGHNLGLDHSHNTTIMSYYGVKTLFINGTKVTRCYYPKFDTGVCKILYNNINRKQKYGGIYR